VRIDREETRLESSGTGRRFVLVGGELRALSPEARFLPELGASHER
jgi:hypothetical protein